MRLGVMFRDSHFAGLLVESSLLLLQWHTKVNQDQVVMTTSWNEVKVLGVRNGKNKFVPINSG